MSSLEKVKKSAFARDPGTPGDPGTARTWRTPGPGYNKGGEYPYPYFYRLYLNFSLFLYMLPVL